MEELQREDFNASKTKILKQIKLDLYQIKERLKLELDLWKQHTKPESDEEFIF